MKFKEDFEFGLFVEDNRMEIQDYYLHLGRYKFASRFVKDKLCLDLGCGTGYGSSFLVKKGAKTVVGGDKSEKALFYAKSCYKSKQRKSLEFVYLNATSLPFLDSSFDVVISFELIEHLKNYERFLLEIKRVLKRGGVLILSTPSRRVGSIVLTDWKYHLHEFSKEELLGLVNKYFVSSKMYGQHSLDGINLVLRRVRRTARRLLQTLGMRKVQILLSRLFRYNRLVPCRMDDFDEIPDKEKVVLLTDNSTPIAFVVTARKPVRVSS